MTDMSKNQSSSEGSSAGENVNNLSYFGQLAAANHVKKLVERYLSLAPVFIGGPANTSLEAPPPHPPPLNETEKGMQMQNATFQVKLNARKIKVAIISASLELPNSLNLSFIFRVDIYRTNK